MKTLARMSSKAPYHVSEEGAQGVLANRNRVVPSQDFTVSYVMLLALVLRLLEPGEGRGGGKRAGDPAKNPRRYDKDHLFHFRVLSRMLFLNNNEFIPALWRS